MANIQNLSEAWAGHSGLEVETFLKAQLTALAASLGGKFGHVAFNSDTMTITFYDEPGGTVLGTVQLGGQVYTVDLSCNLPQVFYVLADETAKVMTISPSTTVSSFGSSTQEPFPESYSYVVAVNSGSGYVNRTSGTINTGGSASFDIRPYLSTGDNYIRITVTGASSGQVKTSVFTGTLTTLTMSCNHAWQNVWTQGLDYNITGIRFAGNLYKTLHVSLDNVELTPVEYNPNQSYTTTATYYTIPASAFPSGGSSGVHSVKLWMTAQGVSTPVISYNIMCAAAGDTTPLVCINAITARAYNFTNGTLFSYAVYNANKVTVDLSATLNSVNYAIANDVAAVDRETGVQYPFAYSLEVDTGANETKIGSLAISATAYQNNTEGNTATASTIFDNTYSYLATPGYLFYLNAATRDNGTANYQTIVNEAGASANFAASYAGTWSGLSWYNDGWVTDPSGYKALAIPAGCTLTVPGLTPMALLSSYDGMTFEFMLQCASPSDYSLPVFSLSSGGNTPLGILIYPTKIVVWGSAERDEDYQTVNFSENAMTHICVTILKGYEGESGKNICSVYINGISNVNFSFDGASSFGNGALTIGQAHTDAYLYKLRIYGSALEAGAVFNNFLNSIVDGVEFNRSTLNTKNNVLLGSSVDYDLVKAAGFNTMVVITPNNEPIPSFFNNVSIDGCTVRFEYAGQQAKNATVSNVSMDGQGTTSKKYFRWNLRWKTGSSTNWVYGDGTSKSNSKSGKMINDSSYIEVDRITAKKNIASSPQGHKMGLTGLYNDLFHQIGLNSELPDTDYRVAVYQFPFVGFQYNSQNQSYEYIGIYTAGPDKGSKKTFGYSSSYPSLMSIEGPNHAPRGTRFLCPWVDVTYSPADETLMFGGEEGWDADYVNYETSTKGTQADWDAILALYNSEWQPAYNCVYDNSPYLASYSEVIADLDDPSITTLADLLTVANASTIKAGTTNDMIVKNEFIAFYDSSYDLYFYRRSTGKYEKLPNDYTGKKNALTDLTTYLSAIGASTSAPTTAQIIQARGARFKATMTDYFSQSQTLYHYCFCLLYGVTDNFAKNSYPFKFQPLSASGAGNRWGWRQDDLDSVLMTDNNGTNTKKYSVEHLDTFDGVQIFQGGDAALWMLIKANYEDECRTMMGQIATAATSLATSLGIAGSGQHESLFNLTSYYCWDHSSKYFPATIYEADRRWAYIEPWLLAGTTRPGTSETYPDLYNGVAPLTQALGDQYQGEKLWMYRRIAYIFSKYHIGAFHGTNTGYNAIVFTLAKSFTFTITPAIDLYPVVSLVDDDVVGDRTPAGGSETLTISTTGDSNNSIHGGDWLASLGDLSGMKLTNRGVSTAIPFSLTGARLQTLKIGDADASKLVDGFNATTFSVTSTTLVTLDARNTATIGNTVDLLGCPRLRTCLFGGSGASGLYLPVGAKLTLVSFPDNATTVFMHSLPFLTSANLTLPTLTSIVNLYINNCAQLNPLTIAQSILAATGNNLAYVTAIWSGIVSGNASTLLDLSELAGSVTFENNTPATVGGKPYVEGTVEVSNLHTDDLDDLDVVSTEDYGTGLKKALARVFSTNLYIIYDPDALYLSFADPDMEALCIAQGWSSDGVGMTLADAAAVTNAQFKAATTVANSNVSSFDELKYFTGVSMFDRNDSTGISTFQQWTALSSFSIPESITRIRTLTAKNAPLTRINITDLAKWLNISYDTTESNPLLIAHHLYLNGTEVTHLVVPSSITTLRQDALHGGSSITELTIHDSFTAFAANSMNDCTSIQRVNIPSVDVWVGITFGASPFYFTSNELTTDLYINGQPLTTAVVPQNTTEIQRYCFYRCTSLSSVTLPSSVTTIGESAFRNCPNLTSLDCRYVTKVWNNAFNNTPIESFTFGGPTTTITGYGFTDNSYVKSVTFQGSAICSNEGGGTNSFRNCASLEELHVGGTFTSNSYCFYNTHIKILEFPTLNDYLSSAWNSSSGGHPSEGANTNGWRLYINGQVLTSLVLPSDYNYTDARMFVYNIGIVSVNIQSPITALPNNAFRECTALTSIAFPSGVTSIGTNCFNGCSSLQTINLENVTSIGGSCFRDCSSLQMVDLSSALTIGGEAFRGCSGLTTVTFADGASFTGEGVFHSCTNLTTLILEGTVTSSTNAFYNSGNISSIHIASIESYLNCVWNNTTGHPFDANSNGGRLYLNGTELTAITIPSTITALKNKAFRRCNRVTSIIFHSGITSIGESAFAGCSSLTSLDILDSVTNIGSYAFSYCSALTSLTCRATTPPTTDGTIFNNMSSQITIYVPAASVDAYKAATGWKTKASIIVAIP